MKTSRLAEDLITAAALVGLFFLIRHGRGRRARREERIAQLEKTVAELEWRSRGRLKR